MKTVFVIYVMTGELLVTVFRGPQTILRFSDVLEVLTELSKTVTLPVR